MKGPETENHRSISMALLVLILLTGAHCVAAQNDSSKAPGGSQTPAAVTALSFREFFEPSARELKPSARLLSLKGKRVRLVGFMAQMEQPLPGSFYLAPRPVFCDEEGGGDADLPPESVLVIVRSAKGREIEFIPGPLEVTGILEIGSRSEKGGRISFVRLILDGPEESPRSNVPARAGEKN